MSQKDKTYSRYNLSPKARLKYRNFKRRERRAINKLSDVTTIEAESMVMSAAELSPQNQNGDPISGQMRVSYNDSLPCLPHPMDVFTDPSDNAEYAYYANGMQPIIQTDTLVSPLPHGSKIRTQNFGAPGGPSEGNFRKMRPIGMVTSPNPAAYSFISGQQSISSSGAGSRGYTPYYTGEKGSPPDPWKDVWIQGSEFPDDKISDNWKAEPNKYIKDEIIPILDKMNSPLLTKGMRALIIIHAMKEGYRPGTRSYRHRNPGNVGNTDSGANKTLPSLEKGITYLMEYINRVANGEQRAYKFGPKTIKPYFSKEMDRNRKTYKKSPYLPGYKFDYTGQIDQYVKIYATGSRAGNSYISLILSYFKKHLGIYLTPQSKIQDIIKIN